ncbi:hypothetical protein RRG08_035867 [Elysia crispata]|uniref:Uncharacterized protein n=1 Tax=Elysia crispata TaxID=231223 RepID=A0AAE1B0I0_9GAST|nr:hypothetical protein RRG08_035867 [Elysia crispata]
MKRVLLGLLDRTLMELPGQGTEGCPFLRLHLALLGDAADSMDTEHFKTFTKSVISACRETGEYLKCKLPIRNKNLALLSTIDPALVELFLAWKIF